MLTEQGYAPNDEAGVALMRERLGLDRPIPEQYIRARLIAQ